MNHLMGHGVFEVSLILHFVGANQNAIFRVKTTALSIRTATAVDIVVMKVAA